MNTAYFERFTLELSAEHARQGSHQGACDADISELLTLPEIASQLDSIDPAKIANELREYGAWDDAELQDADQNRARILWIACGDINTEGKSAGQPVGY